MADTTVNSKVQIEVGVSGDQSVKSIKTELREAKAEAINMARQFGENSAEATKAAQKVAKLKDEIQDLGIKIKGVNPDKFERLATLGSGIAQGFAAAQGAMALFGSESKDLEKTMIKLQGAIALSQGLQGLKDLKLMLSGLNVYVIAFSVAVGLVVKYWKDLSDAIVKTFPSFKVVVDFFDNFKQIAAGTINSVKTLFSDLGKGLWKILTGNFSEGIDIFKNIGKDMAESYHKGFDEKDTELKLEKSIKDRKFQLDLLEAQGKDVLNARLKLAQDELKLLGDDAEKYNAKLIEIEGIKTKIREKGIADRQKADEEAKKKADALLEAEIQAAINAQNAKVKLEANEKKDKEDYAKWQKEQDDKAIKALFDQVDAEGRVLEGREEQRKKDLQDEKDIWNLKLKVVNDGLQAISDLSTLFNDGNEKTAKTAFEIQKEVSIAQAIVSTISAAQAGYEAGMKNVLAAQAGLNIPLAIFNAATATAAGIANINRLKATTYQSKNTSLSPTQGGYQAPSLNQSVSQQRQSVETSTGASGIIRQSNMTKVIVTETDITRVQNRTNTIQRRAIVR